MILMVSQYPTKLTCYSAILHMNSLNMDCLCEEYKRLSIVANETPCLEPMLDRLDDPHVQQKIINEGKE